MNYKEVIKKMESNQNAQILVDSCDEYRSTQEENKEFFYPSLLEDLSMPQECFDLGLDF